MPGNVPPVADERDGLLKYIAQQRDGIRYAAYGLTEEQIRTTPTESAICIGGLIKHVTSCERGWIDTMLQREKSQSAEDAAAAYGADWQVNDDDTLASLLADYEACARETEEAVAIIDDLSMPVPVPRDAPWFPQDVDAWSARWVLLHLVEEIARHAGHADIIREHIDGATMYALMAGAEGWPETPWLKPWQPATQPS
ncbi:MAG: DinB family protein [Nocardioidaceae bacterium]